MAEAAEPTEVPCAPGSRLAVDWGAGNSLHFCSTGEQACASRYDWSTLDFVQRRPAHALAPLFAELQTRQQSSGPRGLPLADISQYAARVSTSLTEELASDELPESDAALQLLHEKAVWELLRICFVDVQENGAAAQALAAWLQRFHALYAPADAQLPGPQLAAFGAVERPEAAPGFWALAARLVALGRTEQALQLLGGHSVWAVPNAEQAADRALYSEFLLLDTVVRLLRRMPEPGSQEADATAARSSWQAQVRALLQEVELWQAAAERSPEMAEGLQQVAAVLCGSPEAVDAAAAGWLELLVAQLLHIYPTLPLLPHLATLLQRCCAAKPAPPAEPLQTVHALLEAAAEQDAQAVVRVCSRLAPWLLAHAPDLLLRAPAGEAALLRELPHLGCTQVEAFRLEYAGSLLGSPSAWHLAAAYLAWCPRHGRAALARGLRALAAGADARTAQRLLALAARYRLPEVAALTRRVQAAQALAAGQLALALQWQLAGGDLAAANASAARLLPSVAAAAAAGDAGALTQLGRQLGELECLLRSASGGDTLEHARDTLGVLHALLRFARGLGDPSPEGQRQAAQALGTLLARDARLAPETAVGLLFAALPLMEAAPGAFGRPGPLLSALEALAPGVGGGAESRAQLQAVTLGLARLAARAHVLAAG